MVTAELMVWFGEEKSCQTKRLWLQMFGWATCFECMTVFSHFFQSLSATVSLFCVSNLCALYSFIPHKLEEAIYQKSSKNYIPQYVWQRAWAAQSNSVLAWLWWLFLWIETSVTFIFPPVFLYPKARDFHLNDFRLQVYCWMFSTMR